MGRKVGNLKHEGMARLDGMRCFKKKKHDAKEECKKDYLKEHGNLKGWNPASVPGKVFSHLTHHGYKDAFAVFVKYANAQSVNRFDQVDFELCKNFLQYEISIGKSVWTVSKEMSALNKVFRFGLSKENCGIPKRKQSEIKRSRGGNIEQEAERPGTFEDNKDQIIMAQATGMRRQSIDKAKKEDYSYGVNGLVCQVQLVEKGGKLRISPVLPRLRKEVTRIVDNAEPGKPIFNFYDKHINNHYYRAGYVKELLQEFSEKGLVLDGLNCKYLVNPKGKDLKRKRKAYGRELEVIAAASGAIGHNRLDTMPSYTYKPK